MSMDNLEFSRKMSEIYVKSILQHSPICPLCNKPLTENDMDDMRYFGKIDDIPQYVHDTCYLELEKK